MIYVWLGLSIVFMLFSFLIYKDLAAPPILSGIIWILVYALCILSKTSYIQSNYIGCFSVAYIAFSLGFFISVPRRQVPVIGTKTSVQINPVLSKPVILFEYFALFVWAYVYRAEILARTSSLWNTIRSSEVETSYFSSLLVNLFPIVSAVALYVWFKNSNKKNRNYFLLTLPPMIAILLTSNRSTWFYVICTFAFVIIYTKQLSNKQIVTIGIIGIAAVMILFSVSSLSKYSNMMRTATNAEKIQYYFNVYFISPPLAFLQWLEQSSSFTYGYGKYTFRFFLALSRVLFPNIDVPNTVMPFTVVDGMRTNVYTILHWYTMDFGLIWAYIIQFMMGFIFGKLYIRVRKNDNPKRFDIILIAMMMSVILGEFFCDTLFVHVSIWIQRIFWCILACRILVIDINQADEAKPRKRIRFVLK